MPEAVLQSSWQGYAVTTHDALLLFEAAQRGHIPKVYRRLKQDERKRLIRSGQIFVFDERQSGIKRWTDGLLWSPSRILHNFLVYRQINRRVSNDAAPPLQHPFHDPVPSPSQAQLDLQAARDRAASLDSGLASIQAATPSGTTTAAAAATTTTSDAVQRRKLELERSLVGSLNSSYPFVENGLCKKTISLEVDGTTHHLISYYSLEDVCSGKLRAPSSMPEFLSLSISPMFLNEKHFRVPPHIDIDDDGVPRYRGEGSSDLHGKTPLIPASLASPSLPFSAMKPQHFLPAPPPATGPASTRPDSAQAPAPAPAPAATSYRPAADLAPAPMSASGRSLPPPKGRMAQPPYHAAVHASPRLPKPIRTLSGSDHHWGGGESPYARTRRASPYTLPPPSRWMHHSPLYYPPPPGSTHAPPAPPLTTHDPTLSSLPAYYRPRSAARITPPPIRPGAETWRWAPDRAYPHPAPKTRTSHSASPLPHVRDDVPRTWAYAQY